MDQLPTLVQQRPPGLVPEPPGYGPSAYGAPAPALSLSQVVTTAFLHRGLLALALILPVLAGLAAALLSERRYVASGALAVLATRESAGTPNLSGFGPSVQSVELLKVVRTEMEIMESDETARRAIARLGGPAVLFPDLNAGGLFGMAAPLSAEEQLARASEEFRRATTTGTDANSNLLRVSFTYTNRDLAIRALGALFDAYFEQRATLYRGSGARLLDSELARYGDQLRELEAAIERIKQERGILEIGQDIRSAGSRLDDLRRAEDGLRQQLASAQSQLTSARSLLASTPERVFQSQEATNISPNDDSRNTLLRLQQERERLAAQYVPGYPALAELDRRIAAAREAVRDSARNSFATTRQVRNPSLELLSGRVVSLQLDVGALEKQLAELRERRAEAETRSASLLEAERVLADMQRRRDSTAVVYQQFATRQAGARVDEDAMRQSSANVQVLQQPTAPLQASGRRRLFAAAGLLAGLVAAAGITLLLALLRRTFASPAEAERGLTLPSLGAFGPLKRAAEDMKEQEEVTELASLLLDARLEARGTGRLMRPQVIQLLSATDGDDDRDRLGRALAIELAARRERATLLVDLHGDGRKHLAALGSQVMPVERIEGHVLAFNTVVPQLWVSHNARESYLADARVAQTETETLLATLRREFDVVLIIGPDRSESYAMRRLTALVDANVLVVRGERTRGPVAREFRDWVLSSGSVLLGIVFTGRRKVLPDRVARLLA